MYMIAFIIFIDDLVILLDTFAISTKIFADDVKVYISFTGLDCALMWQTGLHLISKWADDWQL